jgi:tetratricopeptide (TPR) repeat protein
VRARRYAEAEAMCRAALAIDPSAARVHFDLWDALEAQRKHGELEAAARAVIARDADHADAHARLGRALFAQGRYDDAAVAYRRAVELGPEFQKVRDALAAGLRASRFSAG